MRIFFGKRLHRFQGLVPCYKCFFYQSPLFADASTIDWCLSFFPRAEFRTTKCEVNIHVGLNFSGYLPEFVTVTEVKTHGVSVGRTLKFPKGSIVSIDKGYNDYAWHYSR